MIKILVAEDDSMTMIALEKVLKKWNYEVVAVKDGLSAFEALTSPDPPRVALLDWLMPGMEGVEICRELSGRPDLPLIYTILLTVKKDKADIVDALDHGAFDFLSKPVHVEELRSRIAVGVRLIRAEDKLRGFAMEMKRLAVTDGLTGAYNRRYFFDQAKKEFYRSKRYDTPLSLLLMDIDHFKQVNDANGHLAGDEVLKALSDLCGKTLRESDVLSRYGGEEFAILLPETKSHQAFTQAERLRGALADFRLPHEERVIKITVSFGTASLIETDNKIEDMINRADNALYKAKKEGRNRTVVGNRE